jgi:hypothetical protein
MSKSPSDSFANDPVHWRKRAEEARRLADQISDLQAKAAVLRIAEDYELLAKRAELGQAVAHTDEARSEPGGKSGGFADRSRRCSLSALWQVPARRHCSSLRASATISQNDSLANGVLPWERRFRDFTS